jgi:hypothetical protein
MPVSNPSIQPKHRAFLHTASTIIDRKVFCVAVRILDQLQISFFGLVILELPLADIHRWSFT